MSSSRTLLNAAISAGTRTKYIRALGNFLNWADAMKLDPITWQELDECVVDYLHALWQSKGSTKAGKAEGNELFKALNFFLYGCAGNLASTSKTLRGWTKLAPSTPWPPITWPLCVAIAIKMASCGFPAQGMACLLQFDCLMRISEVTSLTVGNVGFPGDARLAEETKQVLIRFPKTKTGSEQSVKIEDPAVAVLLQTLATEAKGDDTKLFPFSSDSYRKLFRKVCKSLGLSDRYVPHSCRHGGATRMYQRNPLSIEAIMARGRWASSKSARHYIQQGPALLLSVKAPPDVAKAGTLFAADLVQSFKLAQEQKH